MKYRLIIQLPEPLKNSNIIGTLSVDSEEADFFVNERLITTLKRAEIVWINPHGIFLKGFEPKEVTRLGTQKFDYQEWFCAYVEK